ncbi:MAG: PTS fructose transporter subunit IIA [Nitrosomonadales bacterium]|nr:PTS fructose transporter subunit IIA [Nitrosomonadales bacterium]
MIGILLVTHNGLGDSLVDCVRHVMSNVPANLKVLSVLADDDPQRKEEEGRALIAQLDTGDGVLLLSDLFGATPCNIARRLYQPGRVEGVCGVNLPMLLRAVFYSGKPLAEVMQKALESGRNCILSMNSDSGSCNAATGCADN